MRLVGIILLYIADIDALTREAKAHWVLLQIQCEITSILLPQTMAFWSSALAAASLVGWTFILRITLFSHCS